MFSLALSKSFEFVPFRDCPCSLPKSVEQYVYLFSAAESSHDVIRGSLLMLIERGNSKEGNDGSEKKGIVLPTYFEFPQVLFS